MGVVCSGLRVAGLRMYKLPSGEPVMMEVDVGENLMPVVGYWEVVEGWVALLMGDLNLRVSQSLIVSSPPRVTTVRPSELMSRPPVQVSR